MLKFRDFTEEENERENTDEEVIEVYSSNNTNESGKQSPAADFSSKLNFLSPVSNSEANNSSKIKDKAPELPEEEEKQTTSQANYSQQVKLVGPLPSAPEYPGEESKEPPKQTIQQQAKPVEPSAPEYPDNEKFGEEQNTTMERKAIVIEESKNSILSKQGVIRRITDVVSELGALPTNETVNILQILETLIENRCYTIKNGAKNNGISIKITNELAQKNVMELHQKQLWEIFKSCEPIKELIKFQTTLKTSDNNNVCSKIEEEVEGETDDDDLNLTQNFMLKDIVDHYPCIKTIVDDFPQITAFLQKMLGFELKNYVQTLDINTTREHLKRRIENLIGKNFVVKEKNNLIELEYYAKKHIGLVYNALTKTPFGKKIEGNTTNWFDHAQKTRELGVDKFKMRGSYPNLALCFMRILKVTFNKQNEPTFKKSQKECDLHYFYQIQKEYSEDITLAVGENKDFHTTPLAARTLHMLDHYAQKFGPLVMKQLTQTYCRAFINGKECRARYYYMSNHKDRIHRLKENKRIRTKINEGFLTIFKYSYKHKLISLTRCLCSILAKNEKLLFELLNQNMQRKLRHSPQNMLNFIQELKKTYARYHGFQKTPLFTLRAILLIEECEKVLTHSNTTKKLFDSSLLDSPAREMMAAEDSDKREFRLSFWECLALSYGYYRGVSYSSTELYYRTEAIDSKASKIRDLMRFDETEILDKEKINDLMLVTKNEFNKLSPKIMGQYIAYINISKDSLYIKLVIKPKPSTSMFSSLLFRANPKIISKEIHNYKNIKILHALSRLKKNVWLSKQIKKNELDLIINGIKCSSLSPWLLVAHLHGTEKKTGKFFGNMLQKLFLNSFTIMVTELNFSFYIAIARCCGRQGLRQLTSNVIQSDHPSFRLGKNKKQLLQLFLDAAKKEDWLTCKDILKKDFSTVPYYKQEKLCGKIMKKALLKQESRKQKTEKKLYKEEEEGEDMALKTQGYIDDGKGSDGFGPSIM